MTSIQGWIFGIVGLSGLIGSVWWYVQRLRSRNQILEAEASLKEGLEKTLDETKNLSDDALRSELDDRLGRKK